MSDVRDQILQALMRDHDQNCADSDCPCDGPQEDELIRRYRNQVRAEVLYWAAARIERHFPDPNPMASLFEPYVGDRIADALRSMADNG